MSLTGWGPCSISLRMRSGLHTVCFLVLDTETLDVGADEGSCDAKARHSERAQRCGGWVWCVTPASIWPGSHLKYLTVGLLYRIWVWGRHGTCVCFSRDPTWRYTFSTQRRLNRSLCVIMYIREWSGSVCSAVPVPWSCDWLPCVIVLRLTNDFGPV